MNRQVTALALALALLACPASQGLTQGRDSVRATRKWGALVGLLVPYPSLLGLTAAWNTNSYFRVELGVGRQNSDLSHLTTWAVGVKFFVPHWNLSPWASVQYASVSHGGPGTVLGFSRSGSHGYGGIGIEWQTETGFTASAGYNVSTQGSTLSEPMLQIGWFL